MENKVAIAAAGAIAPLIAMLGSPAIGVKKNAAECLWSLAFNGSTNGPLLLTTESSRLAARMIMWFASRGVAKIVVE